MRFLRQILTALAIFSLVLPASAQQVLINGVTPVATRTSASAASPMTMTVNFNSASTFAGYVYEIQASTDISFATIDKFDVVKTLTEADFQSPFTPNMGATGDPLAIGMTDTQALYDNTACGTVTTCYVRARLMARSPQGQYFISAWSNIIQNIDSAIPGVWNSGDKDSGVTLTNGGLTASTNASGNHCVRSNKFVTLGSGAKVVWEVTQVTGTSTFGVELSSASLTNGNFGANTVGAGLGGGNYNANNGAIFESLGSSGTNPVMFAYDDGTKKLKIYRANTVINGSGNGTTLTGVTGNLYPVWCGANTVSATANFGASAYSNTVPSGYSSFP